MISNMIAKNLKIQNKYTTFNDSADDPDIFELESQKYQNFGLFINKNMTNGSEFYFFLFDFKYKYNDRTS